MAIAAIPHGKTSPAAQGSGQSRVTCPASQLVEDIIMDALS
jgi:hypothetical protein